MLRNDKTPEGFGFRETKICSLDQLSPPVGNTLLHKTPDGNGSSETEIWQQSICDIGRKSSKLEIIF
jgi:hypothetical protein